MAQEVTDHRPPPPSWLNKDFIETALRTEDANASTGVLSCELSMANAVGDGYLSNMYRVIAKTSDAKEHRLIVKCEPKGGFQEEFLARLSAFEKETHMLADIIPAMQKLLEQAGIHEPLAAKCFCTGKHPVPFLVLEDLRQGGFTLVERTKGLDMNHCTLTVRAFARFHAGSIALLEQDPDVLRQCRQTPYTEIIRGDLQPRLRHSLQLIEQVVLKWPGYEHFSEKLKELRENAYEHFMSITKPQEGKFNTLVHGDAWSSNIMYKYKDGAPQELRLVDFQCCFYASPALDLQHFLTLCPNEEARENIDKLLQEYHGALTETMDLLRCRSRKITLEELKRDFDDNQIYGFLFAASLLAFMFTDVSKQLNIDDVINSTDAATECTLKVMESGIYERVMKKILLKCEELEVF